MLSMSISDGCPCRASTHQLPHQLSSLSSPSLMASPLAWQGDGPPQTLPSSSPPQYSDQFEALLPLASLTLIAAQLSTLLHTVALASSAASPSTASPRLTDPATRSSHSLSSTLPLTFKLTHSLSLQPHQRTLQYPLHLTPATHPAHPSHVSAFNPVALRCPALVVSLAIPVLLFRPSVHQRPSSLHYPCSHRTSSPSLLPLHEPLPVTPFPQSLSDLRTLLSCAPPHHSRRCPVRTHLPLIRATQS